MKRFAAVLFFFIAFLYNGYARADAAAAVVLEAQTGRVLYAVNETQTLPMASTTKIMTALVALDNADLSDIVTTGDNAYGVTEIEGGGLKHIVKQLGSAGTSDPLDQRATVGWKATKTAEILVDAYMVRIETASTFAGTGN